MPSIDVVYFSKPKKSQVDIVQAAGRALRKNKEKPDKVGRIVVPIILNDNETVQSAAARKKFANLIHVITVLADHDERLEAQLTRSEQSKAQPKGSTQEEEKPKIVLEEFDEDLSAAFRDEIIASSRELLLGCRYTSFAELKAAVLEAHPYEFKGDLSVQFFGQSKLAGAKTSCERLAREAGLLEADQPLTAAKFRELIWGDKNLDAILGSLKKLSPTRPDKISEFFTSSEFEGVFKNFTSLKRSLASLMPRLIEKPTIDKIDIADFTWGTKYKDFAELKTAALEKDKDGFKRIDEFVRFLERNCNIGIHTVARLAQAAGLLQDREKTNVTELIGLIWPKQEAVKDLEQFTNIVRGKYPERPQNWREILIGLLDANRVADNLALLRPRHPDIQQLVLEKKYAHAVLAEHIWPHQETRAEFITRLQNSLSLREEIPRLYKASVARILNEAGVSIYDLVSRFKEFSALKQLSETQDKHPGRLFDLLLPQDPEVMSLYYKTEEILSNCPASEQRALFLNENLFREKFGIGFQEYCDKFLNVISRPFPARATNKYSFASKAEEVLNISKGVVTDSIWYLVKNLVREKIPNPPVTLTELKTAWDRNKEEAEFLTGSFNSPLTQTDYLSFLRQVWDLEKTVSCENGDDLVEVIRRSTVDTSFVSVDTEELRQTVEDKASTDLVGNFREAHPDRPADLEAAKKAVGGLGKWIPLRGKAVRQDLIKKTSKTPDEDLMNLIWTPAEN